MAKRSRQCLCTFAPLDTVVLLTVALLFGCIAVLCTYMQPIVTNRVAKSVSRSVCLSVTVVSPAKAAEPIEMPFGLRTPVGPRNCVRPGSTSPHGRGNFGGGASHCQVSGHSAVNCAIMAESSEMSFGLWAWMGPRNYVLDGVPIRHGKGQF